MPTNIKLILASASSARAQLLLQNGIKPDHIIPANADEKPLKGENPRNLALRLAKKKAVLTIEQINLNQQLQAGYILAADTVVALGRRILPKTDKVEEAYRCLKLLSGRNHRIYTAVCLVTPTITFRYKLVESRIRFKYLSSNEIESYISSNQWYGKAGGYAIQGLAESFVVKLIGSYTNIVGMPMYQTIQMLVGEGYPVHKRWPVHKRRLDHQHSQS